MTHLTKRLFGAMLGPIEGLPVSVGIARPAVSRKRKMTGIFLKHRGVSKEVFVAGREGGSPRTRMGGWMALVDGPGGDYF